MDSVLCLAELAISSGCISNVGKAHAGVVFEFSRQYYGVKIKAPGLFSAPSAGLAANKFPTLVNSG
jgi:hypothetical protein